MSSGYDDLPDDAWFDDFDDDECGGGSGGGRGGSWADGWLAGANATRCSCPVRHPPSCGSYEAPSWGARLRRALFGGGR